MGHKGGLQENLSSSFFASKIDFLSRFLMYNIGDRITNFHTRRRNTKNKEREGGHWSNVSKGNVQVYSF